jgi:hypothetical protein
MAYSCKPLLAKLAAKRKYFTSSLLTGQYDWKKKQHSIFNDLSGLLKKVEKISNNNFIKYELLNSM